MDLYETNTLSCTTRVKKVLLNPPVKSLIENAALLVETLSNDSFVNVRSFSLLNGKIVALI